jgi:putative endonuclease
MNRAFYVYLLATRRDGPLYVGITNDLMRRVSEHKNKTFKGFTARYNVDRLVYFETIEQPDAAILREKQLKRWRREWKVQLIEKDNPEWDDLFERLLG